MANISRWKLVTCNAKCGPAVPGTRVVSQTLGVLYICTATIRPSTAWPSIARLKLRLEAAVFWRKKTFITFRWSLRRRSWEDLQDLEEGHEHSRRLINFFCLNWSFVFSWNGSKVNSNGEADLAACSLFQFFWLSGDCLMRRMAIRESHQAISSGHVTSTLLSQQSNPVSLWIGKFFWSSKVFWFQFRTSKLKIPNWNLLNKKF